MDEVELKRCVRCGEWLPRSAFARNKRKRDGLHYYCKKCGNRWAKEHYDRNKEIIRQINEGKENSECRHCDKCDKLEECQRMIWRMDFWPKCFHGVTEADYYVTTVTERRYA